MGPWQNRGSTSQVPLPVTTTVFNKQVKPDSDFDRKQPFLEHKRDDWGATETGHSHH